MNSANSANTGEQSRIAANSCKSQQMVNPESQSQPGSNVEWNFPAKKHRCLSGQKVFLNVISQGTSLLGYSVFLMSAMDSLRLSPEKKR